MPSIERLLVASAPLQTFIMTARHIYRWENRKETAIYLAVYIFLWISDLILPGMVRIISHFHTSTDYSATIDALRPHPP